ncbi:hypothetical protein ACHHYP_02024 [Achlya hypogyna]|uniref:Uncharacterized protein n=1 Tax=Achlya hypogyna TaxID=1202772 RepID=A0A1V9ZSL2_ACHHY|nr:hypothetical protein ACHHYP_02024 [Achlya hypogyna]
MEDVERVRNRLKQRRHRARLMRKRKELLAEIDELQKVLYRLVRRGNVPPTLLPWPEVAASLGAAATKAQYTCTQLRFHSRRMLHLVRAMTSWVTSIVRSRNLPQSGSLVALVTLSAEPVARRVGLDWFTQHMYHNTQRMLQLSAFPVGGPVLDILPFDCGNDISDTVRRLQIMYDAPLCTVYTVLRGKIWSKLRGDMYPWASEVLDNDMVQSIDANMLYRRSPLDAEESNYYVCREFANDDHAVLLVGNLHQDATQPRNERWRPRMFWYVLESVGPETARLRMMSYSGPQLVNGVVLTWQDELASAGEDVSGLSAGEQFTRYQALVGPEWQSLLESDRAFFTLKPGELVGTSDASSTSSTRAPRTKRNT